MSLLLVLDSQPVVQNSKQRAFVGTATSLDLQDVDICSTQHF